MSIHRSTLHFVLVLVLALPFEASAESRTVEIEIARLRTELDALERTYTRLDTSLTSVRERLDKSPEDAALKRQEESLSESLGDTFEKITEIRSRLDVLERVHSATRIRFGDPIILGPISQSLEGERFESPEELDTLPQHAPITSLPLESVIRAVHEPLWACYLNELQRRPLSPGKVVVKFVIQPNGSVSSATTKSSTLYNPLIEGCVNKVVLGLTFSVRDDTSIVSYPLSFNE